MKKKLKDLLASYIDAPYPIIYINHFDFKTTDDIISDIAGTRNIIEFSNGLGIIDFKSKSSLKKCSLFEFLKLIKDDGYENPTK